MILHSTGDNPLYKLMMSECAGVYVRPQNLVYWYVKTQIEQTS